MDLTFRTENGVFNYRVCAVIKHNNKLLAMKNDYSPYYFLPGGRVDLNETADNAMLRELKEELGIDANIVRPLWFGKMVVVPPVSVRLRIPSCILMCTSSLPISLQKMLRKFLVSSLRPLLSTSSKSSSSILTCLSERPTKRTGLSTTTRNSTFLVSTFARL